MKSNSLRQTDPKDVAAARNQATRQRREKEALDRELIRRMESGPMLELGHIPWGNLEEHVTRTQRSNTR